MSEKRIFSTSIDPGLQGGNVDPGYLALDLRGPQIQDALQESGELFRRKLEPIRGVREPQTDETINTIVNGIVESTQVAIPGEHKIITGSRGEEFVFTNDKYDNLYTVDDNGNVTPRERFVMAIKNPTGVPICVQAPWGTPENPVPTYGTSEAMLAFGLDDAGDLTDDRYIIGDRQMLLSNYEPVYPTSNRP